MHGPFVQPSSGHGLSAPLVVFAVAAAAAECPDFDFSARSLAAQCHAPPIFYSQPSRPLRI
jgi:hypothetical protein